MNKVMKVIGWEFNKYDEKITEESNNTWFMNRKDYVDYVDEKLYEKLKADPRIFENEDLEILITHKDNIDDIEKEYNIEFELIVSFLDLSFGDREEYFDEYVKDNISIPLGEMAIEMNKMTKEELININYKKLRKNAASFFKKYIYKVS